MLGTGRKLVLRLSLLRVFAAAMPMALCGCALHIHRKLQPPPDFEFSSPQTADPHFACCSSEAPVELTHMMTTRRHELLHLQFRSTGDNGEPHDLVEGEYFRSLDPGPKKLVVVMPIWGTSTYPPDKISHGYARRAGRNAQVIWIYGTAPLFPWEELRDTPTEADFERLARQSADRYRTTVVDMRRLLDWAVTRKEIDPHRIAFVGFSMSALLTATLLGNDSRISAAVLMMGAANFADVFAACGDKAGAVRKHAMRDFGWSLKQYHDFFQGLFGPADPVHYTGHYDPDKILMIDAMFDDCMPESARAALWEATGRPERITLMYRHRTAFYSLTPLGLNFTRRKIYRFLDKALK
jgi:hypothetical protein